MARVATGRAKGPLAIMDAVRLRNRLTGRHSAVGHTRFYQDDDTPKNFIHKSGDLGVVFREGGGAKGVRGSRRPVPGLLTMTQVCVFEPTS